MKKALIAISAILFSVASFSQNTFPTPTGDVGIGTTSPSAKLHVITSNGSISALLTGASKGIRFTSSSSITKLEGVDQTGSSSYEPIELGGAYVGFSVAGTEVGRFNSSANFGIGVTSPAEKLDVAGNIKIANGGYLYSATNTNIQAGSSSYIGFHTNGSEQMRILTSGDVGFGTTSPYARINAATSDGVSSALFSGATKGVRVVSSSSITKMEGVDNTGSASYQPLELGGSYVGFSIGGTEVGRFNSSANFGIGVTSPAEKLDVAGNIKIANGGYLYSAANTHIQAGTSSYIGFHTNGSERMKILSDGTVGIGTNITSYSSAYKLLVDGKIGAREIKVTLSNPWPDYVFDKDYKLRSLYTLEKFIQQNKHLPNMPSAADVKKDDGVNLGEMNAKLLEKVEELTLYMIQLKKENDEIKKKLEGILNKDK
jgi:hypothetical protein